MKNEELKDHGLTRIDTDNLVTQISQIQQITFIFDHGFARIYTDFLSEDRTPFPLGGAEGRLLLYPCQSVVKTSASKPLTINPPNP